MLVNNFGTDPNVLLENSKKKVTDNKEPEKNNSNNNPLKTGDNLTLNKNSNKATTNINIFDDKKDTEKPNPWKVKTVHFNAGYVLDNNVVHTGPLRITNERTNTDVTITNYEQVDRKNWEYLSLKKGQRFAPDEPQFNVGFNMTFENNFGVELDGKHNKIIMDGYDQNVHFKGTINGEQIDKDAPLNTYVKQHENTFGNMQISALGTYNLELPAPKNHKFSLITKAGPSFVTVATHSALKEPNGTTINNTTPLEFAGYGGMIENGLRYQFGPKTGRLGIEATHSLSYLNYNSYSMVGGANASHSAVYNSFALKLTVGLSGNKK
ncbi:MAG: hypothetical protein U0457_15480 [Candidatus Sericytochromatia bacterium]